MAIMNTNWQSYWNCDRQAGAARLYLRRTEMRSLNIPETTLKAKAEAR